MSQTRQILAIMFTDIVGYTALMGGDERKALTILERNRSIQRSLIDLHNGRWIKELGDGVMASFTTVSDAVSAAVAIQESVRKDQQFQLRIGIHMSEVINDGDDLFGDGVNIAARIQSAADPDSIYISEVVYRNISNKSEFGARFVRQVELKNVKDPVRLYQIGIAAKGSPPDREQGLSTTSTVMQSIAVLPFINMSNDPEQDYFCDGISEEIINTLTKLKGIRVISRTSAFSFKGKNQDVRSIGESLNASTLLEGSVRKAGNKLRITTQLVRTTDGTHLWSERYDRELVDVFSIQEDIAVNVAGSLKGLLTPDEKMAIRPMETNFEAYECFLKGRQHLHGLVLDLAKEMFIKAIHLDPGYSPAYAGLADVHSWLYEWEGSHAADLEAADKFSMRAIELAPQLADGHSSRGNALSNNKRYAEAEEEYRQAIRLDPNSFEAYYFYGRLCFKTGDIRKSADMFLKASSVRQEDFQSLILAEQSLRMLGDPECVMALTEGVTRLRKQMALDPNDRRALSLGAAAIFHQGDKDEAFRMLEKGLELYPNDSGVLMNNLFVHALDGRKEKALDLLEAIVGKGFGSVDWLKHDPDLESIRDEPRFRDLIKG
jgi:adenylate cyclase